MLTFVPVSDYHSISDVLHVVEQINPKSIFEVGVGFGKWGSVLREVVDVYQGRIHRADWQVRIEGVEIFEGYRNPLWDAVYDRVDVADCREVLKTSGKFDLAMCCDVIEHFTKEEGWKLLNGLMEKCKYVIVTSPQGYFAQGSVFGNEHEKHLSGWEQHDFRGVPHLYKVVGFVFMAVLSHDANLLKAIKVFDAFELVGVREGSLRLFRMLGKRVAARCGISQ
jgi:hypothetical protein